MTGPASGCPSWCTSPADPFDPITGASGVFVRAHETDLATIGAGVLVILEAEDRLTVTATGAELTPGAPVVGVLVEAEHARLTAGQARELAHALLAAADLLEQVTR